jgi:hypothetical protein
MKSANLFIIGAPKAGTSSLISQLSKHPDIFVPNVKEPHSLFKGLSIDWYYYKQPMILADEEVDRLYSASKEENYLVDGSVHYLRFSSVIAPRIKNYSANAKIIAVIREPVSRIKSHYLMDLRSGLVSKPLGELLSNRNRYSEEYIETSKYFNNINNYIEVFGKENVLIVSFDDFVKKNNEVLTNILEFLSLEVIFLPEEKVNEYRMPRGALKFIYKYPWARKCYNYVFADGIKKLLKPLILSGKKPTSGIVLEAELTKKLKDDYHRAVDVFVKK